MKSSRSQIKRNIVQYDVLRTVVTLLVVIGHGRYYRIQTGFGGCDYSALVDGQDISWKIIGLITEFLNAFHMPVFMALGGALFYGSMSRGRFRSVGDLAVNKAKRLLVPFLLVGTLYVFPMKGISGYYAQSENVIWDFLMGQILIQGNTHLWFLPAMFVDFLICYCAEVYLARIPRAAKLAILAVLSGLMWDFPINLIAYPLRYAVWFYAGYSFEQVRHRVDKVASGLYGVCGCVLTAAVYLGARCLPAGQLWSALGYLCIKWMVPVLAGISLYMVCCELSRTRMVDSDVYRFFADKSFGIYLYSDPVNYLVLALAATWAGEFFFGDAIGIWSLYFLRIGLGVGVALGISTLLKRYKVPYVV